VVKSEEYCDAYNQCPEKLEQLKPGRESLLGFNLALKPRPAERMRQASGHKRNFVQLS
jgi:hypothetical protein